MHLGAATHLDPVLHHPGTALLHRLHLLLRQNRRAKLVADAVRWLVSHNRDMGHKAYLHLRDLRDLPLLPIHQHQPDQPTPAVPGELHGHRQHA